MAKPRRTSLADRNSAAIARDEPETATTDAPASPEVEEAPAAASPSGPPAAAPRTPAKPRTLVASRAPRTSVYLTTVESKHARSAYLLDYDHTEDPATSFADWLGGAVLAFADLDVDQRKAVRRELGAGDQGTHTNEKVGYGADVASATEQALRADRMAGEGGGSKTDFFRYAVRWQSANALQRAGIAEFPEPPARLPKLA